MGKSAYRHLNNLFNKWLQVDAAADVICEPFPFLFAEAVKVGFANQFFEFLMAHTAILLVSEFSRCLSWLFLHRWFKLNLYFNNLKIVFASRAPICANKKHTAAYLFSQKIQSHTVRSLIFIRRSQVHYFHKKESGTSITSVPDWCVGCLWLPTLERNA